MTFVDYVMIFAVMLINVPVSIGIATKKNKIIAALTKENAKLKRFLGTVDTNQFMTRQYAKKVNDLTAALNFAKARLERDFEREAVDKIAAGEQH